MKESESVFEIVDASNDEQYWPLGIWPTLEAAKEVLDVQSPEEIGRGDCDESDEYRKIEPIWKRKVS